MSLAPDIRLDDIFILAGLKSVGLYTNMYTARFWKWQLLYSSTLCSSKSEQEHFSPGGQRGAITHFMCRDDML